MSREPASSVRQAAFGPSDSGKTTLIRRWARVHRRQLVIDVTGEWHQDEEWKGELEYVSSMQELGVAFKELASYRDWRVILPVEKVDAAQLSALLAPPYEAGKRSYVQLIGGLCLICDELADVATHSQAPVVRPWWNRGRHHGLSVLGGSQRPTEVMPAVRTNSRLIAVTATSEASDLSYWRGILLRPWYEELLRLEKHQAVLWDRVEMRATVITTKGEVVKHLPTGRLEKSDT